MKGSSRGYSIPFLGSLSLRQLPVAGPHSSFSYLGDDFILQIRSLSKTSGAVQLSFSDRDIHLSMLRGSTYERSLSLILRSEMESGESFYVGCMSQMEQIIAKALPDKPLTLTTTAYMHSDFQPDVLGRFPSITKIIFRGESRQVRTVFQCLAQRHPNPSSGVVEWPCPRLKELDLRGLGKGTVEAMRAAVEGRWVRCEKLAEGSEKATEPDGLVRVLLPCGKLGRVEIRRPVQEARGTPSEEAQSTCVEDEGGGEEG